MNCVAKRWAGKGTTVERPTDSALSKEVEDKLKDIHKARTAQDQVFSSKKEETELVVIGEKIEIPIYKNTRGF